MLAMANDQTFNPLMMQSPYPSIGIGGDPSQMIPQGGYPMPQADGPSAAAEQMRHQAAQMTQAIAAQGAPPAPALPGAQGVPAGVPGAAPEAQMGPPSPMDQANQLGSRGLALGEFVQGDADEAMSKTQMLQNAMRSEHGIRQEAKGDAMLLKVKADKGAEQNKIDEEAVGLARQQEEAQKRIATEGQMAADAQMKRVMSAADDASQASIHNFWQDRGAASRVIGVLAQAFSGAANGLAGNPSAPTPLDRIIERDMNLQMANLQQKNRNLENQRGVLRDLYEKTGSSMQATTAMYVAAWKRIDLQGQQLASKFATPEAQAGYEKLKGIADQRISAATDKTYATLHSQAIQERQHAMNRLAEDDRTAAMSNQAPSGENAKIYHLAGVKGAVDERTYKNFKDEDQNYRGFVKQAEHVDWLFKHGSGDNGADWQDYNGARSAMFATLRQMQKTGAALSDAELKNAEAMLPSLAKGEVPGLAWLTNSRNMMKRIMATASRGHFSTIDGTIEGVQLDPNDMRFGHHVRNYVRESAAQQNAQQQTDGDG